MDAPQDGWHPPEGHVDRAILAAASNTVGTVTEVKLGIGRNDNWMLRSRSGEAFAKRLVSADRSELDARFRRIVSFERNGLPAALSVEGVHIPRAIGLVIEDHIAIWPLVANSESAHSLLRRGDLDRSALSALGKVVGTLHSLDPATDVARDLPWIPVGSIEALPFDAYLGATNGELNAWNLVQTDDELVHALCALAEENARCTDIAMAHGDLKLDQVLVDEYGDVVIIDWEQFQVAPRFRDVSGVIASLLYDALYSIPAQIAEKAGTSLVATAPTENDILLAGVEAVEASIPSMHAFREGYESVRPIGDETFWTLTARATGWYMYERMFASGAFGGRLSGIDRICAGIGRNLITDPTAYFEQIGVPA